MKIIKLVLKILFLPLTILGFILGIFGGSADAAPKKKKVPTYNEDHFTELLAKDWGFEKADSLAHRLKPDLQYDVYIIEVDWEQKMYEGLGQALTYAYYADMKPAIVILDDVNKNVNFKKFLEVFEHYDVQVWVAEVNKQTGEILSVTEH